MPSQPSDELAFARRQVTELQQQLHDLHQRFLETPGDRGGLGEAALAELYAALEEMQVGEEELRVQNEELARTSAELESERRKFQQLLDLSPEAYLVTDEAGVIREANPAVCRLLGIPARRLIGKPVAVFVPQEDRRAFRAELARKLSQGTLGECELTLQSRERDPLRVACEIARSKAPSPDGESLLFWRLRDRAEPEPAEERAEAIRIAAESARVQVETIIRHLPIGVIVVEAPSGRMLTYNPAAEEMFAFPLPLADAVEEYSELYHGFHADGRPYESAEWPLARATRGGEVVVGEEIEIVRLDRVRRTFRFSAAPIRDEEGRIVAAVAGLHDVTDEKRRVEMQRFLGQVSDVLSASLDYQETVQRIAELCARVLADFCVVHVQEENRVRGLGVAAADPEREGAMKELLRRLPIDPESDQPVMEVLRTGEAQIFSELSDESLARFAQDEERAVELRRLGLGSIMVLPMNSGGRTLGTVSLARARRTRSFDGQDLEVAQELALRAAHAVDNARLYREAQRAARVQEDTISVVSHDLRNALNAALTNADLLLDITPAFEEGSRERRQMEAVRRSLDHMHRLVQDLLEVDRIERGRLSIHPDRLDPRMLVEELNNMLGLLARDSGLHWQVEIPDRIAPVRADHSRLVQVLSNLVGNAVKATSPGGRVTVRAENGRAEVRFHVTDTGAGIDPEHLPRVFDRFFQVPARGKAGSGLGLTIARGLVEAHGGRMWATSRPGEGSTFSFTIPKEPRRRTPAQ